MVKSTKKKPPPSRLRYEESHPVISFRTAKGIYDQLEEVREKTGQSWADLIKVALNLQKPVLTRKPDDRELKVAFEEGWEEAWKEYSMVFPCSKCGKDIIVDSENRQFFIQYLKDHGIKHKNC